MSISASSRTGVGSAVEQAPATATALAVDMPAARQRRSRPRALLLAGLAVLLTVTLLQAIALATQEHLLFRYSLLYSALYYGTLGLLAPGAWRACAWLTARRLPLWLLLLAHLGLMILFLGAWTVSLAALLYILGGKIAVQGLIMGGGLWAMLQSVLVYGALLATVLATQSLRRLRQEQARAAEVLLLARESEVRALRAQLRPHFLFNVLNSIYAMIPSRPREAQRMVELVGDLMRQTLDFGDTEMITLDDEIGLVSKYLEIEGIRLGGALEVEWQISPESRELLVPPFLLQPLVENSVKHGIAPYEAGGKITVGTLDRGEHITIQVLDGQCTTNLAAAESAAHLPEVRDQHGLGLTARRLQALYGERAQMKVARLTGEVGATQGADSEHGFAVWLHIPRAMAGVEAVAAPSLHKVSPSQDEEPATKLPRGGPSRITAPGVASREPVPR